MRIVFMGTPEFSVNVLEGLLENTNVIMVVTQPDKEVGRHHELAPTPIKKVAIEHNPSKSTIEAFLKWGFFVINSISPLLKPNWN